MNRRRLMIRWVSFLSSVALAVSADRGIAADLPAQLHCDGIAGNSGEQGTSLVRFGADPGRNGAPGIGVVQDRAGTLWSRAGNGVLNRYAPDGRQIATFKLPAGNRGIGARETICLAGDLIVLRLKQEIYTLSTDAAPGAAPARLSDIKLDNMSLSSAEGWLAGSLNNDLFVFNAATGQRKPVLTLAAPPREVELLPDGTVAALIDGRVRLYRVADGKEATPDGQGLALPGERIQFLDKHWYTAGWHGTLRRFSANGRGSPGVVLGGASGSFIGHLEANVELTNPRGLARVRDDLIAISGIGGIVQMAAWQQDKLRYELVRRIGSVSQANGLGLDVDGNVWWQGGSWRWGDRCDSPLHATVHTGDNGTGPVAVIGGEIVVLPLVQHGKPAIGFGPLDKEIEIDDLKLDAKLWPTVVAGFALARPGKELIGVMVDAQGVGRAVRLGRDGRPNGDAGEFILKARQPLKSLTSLTSVRDGARLLASVEGAVVEFSFENGQWQESDRWEKWAEDESGRFGDTIRLVADGERLWVSDTQRHRVLVFDLSAARPTLIASFGQTDHPGDDLTHLNAPSTIAAAGDRCVVFDSRNQRLAKLSLSGTGLAAVRRAHK